MQQELLLGTALTLLAAVAPPQAQLNWQWPLSPFTLSADFSYFLGRKLWFWGEKLLIPYPFRNEFFLWLILLGPALDTPWVATPVAWLLLCSAMNFARADTLEPRVEDGRPVTPRGKPVSSKCDSSPHVMSFRQCSAKPRGETSYSTLWFLIFYFIATQVSTRAFHLLQTWSLLPVTDKDLIEMIFPANITVSCLRTSTPLQSLYPYF